MRRITVILIVLSMLTLPISAFGKGMEGGYMSENGIVRFYCGGRVEGIEGYTSYRQLGENRVKLYKPNGEGRVYNFMISLDKNKIWLSPENVY